MVRTNWARHLLASKFPIAKKYAIRSDTSVAREVPDLRLPVRIGVTVEPHPSSSQIRISIEEIPNVGQRIVG
jgi:hypothetical protein